METDEMVEPETMKKVGEPAVEQITLKKQKGRKREEISPVKSADEVAYLLLK